MADMTRGPSQEYWRPAPGAGSSFRAGPTTGNEKYCVICGTPYAIAARFCHSCGVNREDALQKRNLLKDWLDWDAMRTRLGLSMASLICVLAAAIFVMAAVITGLVYNTSTLAEWQAVQIWRIEWLLATVAALLAAMLFKNKP